MKVFQLNDCDWYMAPTLEEAISHAMEMTGLSREDVCDDPHELSADHMERIKYRDDDGTRRTFAEELERRVAAGAKTEMFASTEC